jgi:hypothetical protein
MKFRIILVFTIIISIALPLVESSIHDFEFKDVEVETSETSATIRWKTTVETSSYLHYQAAENFIKWGIKGIPSIKEPYNLIDPRNEPAPTDYPYMLNHSITITNLKPNTTYMFQIRARDIYDYPQYFESNFTTLNHTPEKTPTDVSQFAQKAVEPSIHPYTLIDEPLPTPEQIISQLKEKTNVLYISFILAAVILAILYKVSK